VPLPRRARRAPSRSGTGADAGVETLDGVLMLAADVELPA
jgi:hypothetical protein